MAPAVFDSAPRWQKSVFGLMGLVAIGVAAYMLVISPLQTRVNTLRARHAELERTIAQQRAILADLARFRRMVAEVEERLASLRERLPTEKETPPLYRSLSDAAFNAGLGVSLFQPKEPKVRDYFSEIPITLRAEGGYHQLGDFFERVAGLSRVVNVTEWKLGTSKDTKNPIAAELTLATYMYRPVGTAPTPKSPTPGAKATPGTKAAPAASAK
jgi:type IV pilus assembly protein PilO